jgi:hypothetical protein
MSVSIIVLSQCRGPDGRPTYDDDSIYTDLTVVQNKSDHTPTHLIKSEQWECWDEMKGWHKVPGHARPRARADRGHRPFP